MTDEICLLVALLLPDNMLVRCAVKFFPENLPESISSVEMIAYFQEPDIKEVWKTLLPESVRDGVVLEVQEILEVHIWERPKR